jgi:pimeloyl-ACP methyl ester carboxylesterase
MLNPSFLDEDPAERTAPRKKSWWGKLAVVWRLFKAAGGFLLTNPLTGKRARARLKIDDGLSPFQRFCRGLLYRLAFVPVIIVLAVAAFVYKGTHPRRQGVEIDPSSQGVFYDPVSFTTEDGVRIEGWLVPMYDATLVLAKRDEVLRKKHPAVVLVHGFGQNRQQVLPLVKPLHDAGFVVLAVNTRGCGQSEGSGSTFGLREALDIQAAIFALRGLAYVDGRRIGVVGVGTGATAAMITARKDATVAAIVLDRPVTGAKDIIADYIGPTHHSFLWMQPLCKWGFEMAYRVDAEELDSERYASILKSRPVLMLDTPTDSSDLKTPATVVAVRDFLKSTLKPAQVTASAR